MVINCCASSLRRAESVGHVLEQAAVVVDQVETGEQDQHQHGCHEKIDIALHAGINAVNARGGLLLGFDCSVPATARLRR